MPNRVQGLRGREAAAWAIVGMRRIWLERNTSVFDNKPSPVIHVVNQAIGEMYWLVVMQAERRFSRFL